MALKVQRLQLEQLKVHMSTQLSSISHDLQQLSKVTKEPAAHRALLQRLAAKNDWWLADLGAAPV